MRHFFLVLAVIAACAAATKSAHVSAAEAPNSPAELRSALDDLERWLGPSENGRRWREFLKTDPLRTELTKAAAADPKAVADILTLFASQTPGLDSPKFQRVRQALQTWFNDFSESTPDGLKSFIMAGKGKYTPVSNADVNAAKNSVANALQQLNTLLGKGPNGDAWRAFLKLNELQASLPAGAPPSPEVLKSVEQQLSGGETGLDLPQFDGLRKSIVRFEQTLAASANPAAASQFDERLDKLVATLDSYRTNPTDAGYQQLGTLLRELNYTGQAAPAIRAIRRNYRYPNFLAEVSAPVVTAGVDRDVDETMQVTDEILGTWISGTGHTVGKVRMRLVPDPGRALLETVLTGTTYTKTVGEHDPVTIFSTGVTTIYGCKPIQIDANGTTGLPASAKAETHTQITGLQVNRNHLTGIIEKAAWKRIGQSKGEAEEVGSQHAQQKIIDRLNQQANPMIAKNNASMNDRFRRPLNRYGAYPELHYSTSPEYLSVTSTAAAEDQVAAPAAPPEFPSREAASVRMHETALNNLAVKCYGGRRITRNDLKSADAEKANQRLREIFIMDEAPDTKKEGDEEANDKTISFVFDKERPVVITLAEQTMNIFMRVTDLTVDEENSGDWDITAQYALEKTDTGVKATLKPEAGKKQPDVVPAGFDRKTGGKIPGNKLKYVTTLRRKFGEQLKPEFNVKYVVLPGDWSKAGKLLVSNLQCDHGWLALSFKQDGPVPPKTPADKPAE